MDYIHKPCLARAAVTSSARVANWGDSSRLMLPVEEPLLIRRGVAAALDWPGDSLMISAPWSTRALADSRKCSFWLSILIFPPPGVWWALSSEPIFACAFSLKSSFTLSIFTRPPPGLWRMFFKDPHLDVTWLRSIFLVTIWICPPFGWYLILSVDPIFDLTFLRSGNGWFNNRICFIVAGDFGGVRMMATFFSLGSSPRDFGVPGVRGVLG